MLSPITLSQKSYKAFTFASWSKSRLLGRALKVHAVLRIFFGICIPWGLFMSSLCTCVVSEMCGKLIQPFCWTLIFCLFLLNLWLVLSLPTGITTCTDRPEAVPHSILTKLILLLTLHQIYYGTSWRTSAAFHGESHPYNTHMPTIFGIENGKDDKVPLK